MPEERTPRVPHRLLPLLIALFTAGLPLPATMMLGFEASTGLGAVKLNLGWAGMPGGVSSPVAYRVIEVYEAVCASLSGRQTQRVTRQTEIDPDAGDTVINGMAPVTGAPCKNDSGSGLSEEGKWETVELVSATAYPTRIQ
jgi:hypothetical protein